MYLTINTYNDVWMLYKEYMEMHMGLTNDKQEIQLDVLKTYEYERHINIKEEFEENFKNSTNYPNGTKFCKIPMKVNFRVVTL